MTYILFIITAMVEIGSERTGLRLPGLQNEISHSQALTYTIRIKL